MQQLDKQKQQLLKSLIEKPSEYEVEVLDNSMLPIDLKEKKTIKLIIKPPTLEVLAKCALPALKIPEHVREATNIKLEEAVKYIDEISETLAILSHGESTPYPEWMIEFFKKNLTGQELYYIFYESMVKLQTDFFLKSFQVVSQNNPMMMNNPKNSIPTN